jgi:ABC-type lipoprotein release transport system permease subunit
MLFGLASTDVRTYLAIVAAIVLIAVLATWHPARHASRVDPSALLRE